MSIKDVCRKNVATIRATATLAEASRVMSEKHVGSLVVVEAYDGKFLPSGIITDRDLALALGSSSTPTMLMVNQIMITQPITVQSSAGIYEAIELMEKSGVKRLPVVDEGGALCGIVSADDLASLVSQESAKLAKIGEIQARNESGIRMPIETNVRM